MPYTHTYQIGDHSNPRDAGWLRKGGPRSIYHIITKLPRHREIKNFCGQRSWNNFLCATGTLKLLSLLDFLEVDATLILISFNLIFFSTLDI